MSTIARVFYPGNESATVYDSSHPQMGEIWIDDKGVLHIEDFGGKLEIHGIPFSLHFPNKNR